LAYHHRTRGFGTTPSLLEMLTGGLDEYQFHLHVDRIPFSELPSTDEDLTRWVFERFQIKNDFLARLKEAYTSTTD